MLYMLFPKGVSLKSRWIIIFLLAVVLIGTLLWFAPNIMSYFQNSADSSNASYSSLTLRDGMNSTATLEFGDTEYNFAYTIGILSTSTFIGGSQTHWTPHKGEVYNELGIEVRVSDVASDYVSNYIVILVKPTIQNYMASLHYTRVNITLHGTRAVNISSGLINKTNQYWFLYTQITHPTLNEPQLTIGNASQQKTYFISVGKTIKEFEIETRVFKIESNYMVIYVKPLY